MKERLEKVKEQIFSRKDFYTQEPVFTPLDVYQMLVNIDGGEELIICDCGKIKESNPTPDGDEICPDCGVTIN